MKLKKYDSINVIPFIDVLLVLLAIVLMTSTFISKGIIPISLPKAQNSEKIKKQKEIYISIKSGEFYFQKEKKSFESLVGELKKLKKDTLIFIQSDKNEKFEFFVNILDVLKKENFTNISIVTKR